MFGPAGADEWMAFITDSEGNLVGLASQNPPTDLTWSGVSPRGRS